MISNQLLSLKINQSDCFLLCAASVFQSIFQSINVEIFVLSEPRFVVCFHGNAAPGDLFLSRSSPPERWFLAGGEATLHWSDHARSFSLSLVNRSIRSASFTHFCYEHFISRFVFIDVYWSDRTGEEDWFRWTIVVLEFRHSDDCGGLKLL